MESLLAFGAALIALRLAGRLASRWRERRAPELAAWAAGLLAFGLASGALAWGSAAGWSEAPFRLYYLFGGLLTAALLGTGSLLLVGRRAALPAALLYTGLAVGVALAEPLAEPVRGDEIPEAQRHLDLFPARVLAVAGNAVGTLAVAGVALATLRRRPLGNALVLAGIGVAAVGSALFGLALRAPPRRSRSPRSCSTQGSRCAHARGELPDQTRIVVPADATRHTEIASSSRFSEDLRMSL